MRGCSAAEVDVVEGHGTGTTLGDPIEAQALLATYGQDRASSGEPLWLGSIKSNMGHTQAAAGVAGCDQDGAGDAPRGVAGDVARGCAESARGLVGGVGGVADRGAALAGRGPGRGRAGVSSFGISGTNAHVIVEARRRPRRAAEAGPMPAGGAVGGVGEVGGGVGGAGRAAGRASAGARASSMSPTSAGRWRAGRRSSIAPWLSAPIATGCWPGSTSWPATTVGSVVRGVATPAGKTVFVFPGQGSQWLGMGVELLDTAPVFAAQIEACAEAFAEFVDWSLTDVLRGAPGAPGLDRVDVVQPVLFAVMVSLAELWKSVGVRPDAVIGHSQGEIAAAYVAGALSLRDAARRWSRCAASC